MGRPRAVDDTAVFEQLAAVFRTTGFEGASLSGLAAASGLRSASLYHRFPDGKAGMAVAVLNHVEQQLAEVLAPIGSAPDPADGVRRAAAGIADFYADGRLACVLDTMTLSGAPAEVRQRAADLARGFIDAMTTAAARAGADADEATRRARDAFVRIEGSLVLARVLDDTSEFLRTLAALPDLLTLDRTETHA